MVQAGIVWDYKTPYTGYFAQTFVTRGLRHCQGKVEWRATRALRQKVRARERKEGKEWILKLEVRLEEAYKRDGGG